MKKYDYSIYPSHGRQTQTLNSSIIQSQYTQFSCTLLVRSSYKMKVYINWLLLSIRPHNYDICLSSWTDLCWPGACYQSLAQGCLAQNNQAQRRSQGRGEQHIEHWKDTWQRGYMSAPFRKMLITHSFSCQIFSKLLHLYNVLHIETKTIMQCVISWTI